MKIRDIWQLGENNELIQKMLYDLYNIRYHITYVYYNNCTKRMEISFKGLKIEFDFDRIIIEAYSNDTVWLVNMPFDIPVRLRSKASFTFEETEVKDMLKLVMDKLIYLANVEKIFNGKVLKEGLEASMEK